MKLPEIKSPSGLTTAGATGIVLMVLHILGHLDGWAWPILYVLLIIIGIGQENKQVKSE